MAKDNEVELMGMSEVEKKIGRSRWWIRKAVTASDFPTPVSLGGRRILFVRSEIEEWLKTKLAQRGGKRRSSPPEMHA